MLAAVVAALASCQSKANKAAEAQADSLAPVSYTHLDVYKRQIQNREKRNKSGK